MSEIQAITNVAQFLKLPDSKIFFNDEKIVTRADTKTNKNVTGFATILHTFVMESQSNVACDSRKSREILAQVYQWFEYAALYVTHGIKDKQLGQQLLRDLNEVLLTRSYLVGFTLTLADVAIFYTIYDLMKSILPNDKEKYLNISRWFNHIQNHADMKQRELINLSTIYLHGNNITSTHK